MNMIEKVARGIDAAADAYIKDWQAKSEKNPTLMPYIGMADVPMEILARAAIEALREPTEGMIVAGLSRANGFASAGNRMCNGYRGMIDAAISEPVTPPTSSDVSA